REQLRLRIFHSTRRTGIPDNLGGTRMIPPPAFVWNERNATAESPKTRDIWVAKPDLPAPAPEGAVRPVCEDRLRGRHPQRRWNHPREGIPARECLSRERIRSTGLMRRTCHDSPKPGEPTPLPVAPTTRPARGPGAGHTRRVYARVLPELGQPGRVGSR